MSRDYLRSLPAVDRLNSVVCTLSRICCLTVDTAVPTRAAYYTCDMKSICAPNLFCPRFVTKSNMLCSVKFFLLDTWRNSSVSSVMWDRFLACRAKIAGYILSCCSLPPHSAADSQNVNDYESARVR